MMDYTLNKYRNLIKSLETYDIMSIKKFLLTKPEKNYILFRHDVDRDPKNAMKMALLESKLDIQSTYYFRYKENTYKPKIIKSIYDMGHEIGYHYEVLSKANGDYDKANTLFQIELSKFRELVEISTVCMHGSPLSKYNNVDFWSKFSLNNFDLLGDAMVSISNIPYFTDTGRNWNNNLNFRDYLVTNENHKHTKFKNTDDLCKYINKHCFMAYLVVHPERWDEISLNYFKILFRDQIINCGKRMFKLTRAII